MQLALACYSLAARAGHSTHTVSQHHQHFQVVLAARVIRALLHTRSVMRHPPGRAGCSYHTSPAHFSSSAHASVQATDSPGTLF